MLHFRVLGPLDVQRVGGDDNEISLTRPLERRLLAVLLANAGRVMSTDELIEALWPTAGPAHPERALQTSVSRLRKILSSTGPGSIVAHSNGGYHLDINADSIDARRFELLVAEAAQQEPAEKADTLQTALGLWRGVEAYSDFRYDDFAAAESARLEDLRLVAVEDLIDARLAGGESDQVIPDIEVLIKEHPLREGLYGMLMIALYRAGRQAEALRTYQSARRYLASELGIEPGPRLTELEERVLLQDPTLDLPEHSEVRPNNLPTRIGSLIGRADDIDIAEDRLVHQRLLTITGPGGVGKTTLAIEVARACSEHYADGVWLVSLEGIQEPSQVAEIIGVTLRRPLRVRSDDSGETLDALITQMATAQLLLVIDNCEHLIDEVARVVQRILEGCPRVSVLATSREQLVVTGESLLPLAPFDVSARLPATMSTVEAIARSSALQLFQERAQAIDPTFVIRDGTIETVLRICRRLDGLPLAIELAAAQVGVLSLSEIADQLNSRFELLRAERAASKRHQTLEAAIEWSYQLLEPEDQRLLQQLATIRTPFSSSVAAGITGHLDGPAIFAALRRLRGKSMLQVRRNGVAETQYELLRSIRAFARGKATEAGSDQLDLDAHAVAFLSLAREAYGRTLGGSSQIRWLTVVNEAAADFELAIDTFISRGRAADAIEICASIGWVWFAYRHQEQGYRVVEKVLDAAPDDPSRDLARVHITTAGLLLMDGVGADSTAPHNAAIQDHLSIAVAMADSIGDTEVLAEAKVWDGYHHWYMGEAERALEILVPIRDAAAEHGYDRALMFTSLAIGGALNLKGASDEAIHNIQRALGLAHTSGDGYVQCLAYAGLASVLRNAGEFGAASVAYHSGYLMAARYGFPMYTTVCAAGEAITLWIDGQAEAAAAAAKRALAVAAGRPRSDGFRSFQNLMADPDIGMTPEQLAGKLRAIFTVDEPERTTRAIDLLLDLFRRHAVRHGLEASLPAIDAAIARLP